MLTEAGNTAKDIVLQWCVAGPSSSVWQDWDAPAEQQAAKIRLQDAQQELLSAAVPFLPQGSVPTIEPEASSKTPPKQTWDSQPDVMHATDGLHMLRRANLDEVRHLFYHEADLWNGDNTRDSTDFDSNKDECNATYATQPGLSPIDGLSPATGKTIIAPDRDHKVPVICYHCGHPYLRRHTFYGALCVPCGTLNYQHRLDQHQLPQGTVALVTGARIRLGFACAVKLLRCGASRVLITTRFPRDALRRYSALPDWSTFCGRLSIAGVDFRDVARVEAFAKFAVRRFPTIRILINSACQTVRRPSPYYRDLVHREAVPLNGDLAMSDVILDESAWDPQASAQHKLISPFQPLLEVQNLLLLNSTDQAVSSATTPRAVSALSALLCMDTAADDISTDDCNALFPTDLADFDGQPIDLRSKTSWVATLDDTSTTELTEVLLINVLAPMILQREVGRVMAQANARHAAAAESSSPLLPASILHVSAREGVFFTNKKTVHPHTDACKAALNMLVRSSAASYARKKVYVNAVDPGWMTVVAPLGPDPKGEDAGMTELSDGRRIHARSFRRSCAPPLDAEDGAARVLHPVFAMARDPERRNVWGQLFKNFVASRIW